MNFKLFLTLAIAISLMPFNDDLKGQQIYIKNSEVAKEIKARKLIIIDRVFATTINNGNKINSVETKDSLNANKAFLYFKKFWSFNSEIEIKNYSLVKELIKNKNEDFIYAIVEHVVNNSKTTKSRSKPSITTTYNYYAISFYQPDKKNEICTIEIKNEHFADLEIISSINIIDFFLNKIAEGSTRSSVFTEINNEASQLKNKTLLITDHFSNLAGIEKEEIFPKKIEMVSHEDIIEKIENKKIDCAYAMVFHISSPFSKGGENFRTVILNTDNIKPIYIYTWINLYGD